MISKIITIHKPFLFFIVTLFAVNTQAQIFPDKQYPHGYFIYPIEAKIALAANFGELRPNHFHMGLDCRSDQKQNRPVRASADGYIAHVKIEPAGFGRAIYINHPNGLTTLYGHLNDFFPALEKYVKEQQYKGKTWKVFLDIPEGLFPVKQGQFIAYSGNTGGSQGPHLHFEIRDTKADKVLNPLLFGFPIPDNVPPAISRLAVYDRSISTYSQQPKLMATHLIGGAFSASPIVVNTRKVSFGISAVDRVSGSANPNGIYQAILFFDETTVCGFQIDSISYDDTRYVNAHIDYKTKVGGGPYIEHLSRLPGYPQGVYRDVSGDGVIQLNDNEIHQCRIEVKDPSGNTSQLKFSIRNASLNKFKFEALYQKQEFQPGFINVFEKEDIQVILGEKDLYDSFQFVYSKRPSDVAGSISDIHSVHNALVPVQNYYTIKIKPSRTLLPTEKDRVILQRTWGKKTDVIKAKHEGEWFVGQFREFGNMQLLIDNDPPRISGSLRENANMAHSSHIVFIVTDNNHSIKNFHAELDGQWLRFTNDKGVAFIYKFDEMCPSGEHELKVHVEDEAGNVTEKTYHFTR